MTTFKLSSAAVFLLARMTSIVIAQDDRLSPDQALATFTVASGLEVKTFASDPDIVSISNLDIDHRGRVWACECINYRGNNGKRPDGDRILILEDTNGDGVSNKTTVFYQGREVDVAMGLCVLGNKAIVSVAPEIFLLEDTDGDDRADRKTVLFTSDAVYQHDHSLHSFVFGPDGRFYFNFGNTGRSLKTAAGAVITTASGKIVDDGKPFHGGMVFRCDHDFTNVEVLGHNFRNNYEATVDSFGGIWQSDNDDDGNLAVRLNYIFEGGNYGYLDELTGEGWQKPRIGAHPYRGKRHWHQNDPGAVPNVLEMGNGAPAGITIYEGRLLPEVYWDQVIHCDAGPHVVWGLPTKKHGAGFTARKVDILRSTDNNFRPIDVAVAPDGSLVVSDWYDPVVGGFAQDDIERGRIYWIAPQGHKYSPPSYDLESASGAVEALKSPNYCARYLAWKKLHALGAQAAEPLDELLKDSNPRLRARSLWLLGQIPGRESNYIDAALKDSDEEVRIMGLRLADLLKQDVIALIHRLAGDPSPRVRAECAVRLRYHDSTNAALAWAKLAAQHDGKDRWYLEALGIGAQRMWDSCLFALQQLDARQDESAKRDIVWRSRSDSTAGKLAEILKSADEDLRRYVRAFDFQPVDKAKAALLPLAIENEFSKEVALAVISRVDSDKFRAAGGREKLIERLGDDKLDGQAIELIKRNKVAALYPRLLQCAQDENSEHRVDALESLLELQQETLVLNAILGDDRKAAVSTALVVAQVDARKATWFLHGLLGIRSLIGDTAPQSRTLAEVLQRSPMQIEDVRAISRTFAESSVGASHLLSMAEDGTLFPELRHAIAGPLLSHRNAHVRSQAEKLFPLSKAKDARPLPRLSDLIRMQGQSDAGKLVFNKQGKCASCHQVQGEGKAIGPDLSQIGTKLARSAIFEAVLYPNAAISHNFESYTAVLNDGQTVTGLIVNQSDQQIQLRDAEGILRTLNRSEVEDFKRQNVSLMPSNLHEAMTPHELVDLVAYVSTLKLEEGFESMFDGKTLEGWTCAPLANTPDWFTENGSLVGASNDRGSYLAWTAGGELRNFDARLSYRIRSPEANTGLQVRSKYHPDDWPYPLKGYQADIGHVGIGPKVLGGWDFHGEPRGDILVSRGYRVLIAEDGSKTSTPLENAITKDDILRDDWNDVRVVAMGDKMTFYVNDQIASEVIDLDKLKRVDRGYLGLQLHHGDSMRVEFRNLRVKKLDDE